MGCYSALIVQRRARTQVFPTWETSCPTIRVPLVTGLTVETAIPGGWQQASFTIPAQRSRLAPELYGTKEQPNVVWIYDGLTVAFFGLLVKATPLPNGDIQCQCDGSYKQLATTRMREVWGDNDLSGFTPAPNNAGAAQVNVDANGDLTLALPAGASPSTGNLYPAGTHAAADYFLFGEAAGARDGKRLDGWDVSLGGNFDGFGSFEVRIYGLTAPGASPGDLLQTFQNTGSRIETADGTRGGVNTASWPIDKGYRCFRIGLWVAASVGHLDNDVTVKVHRFNVSTRATAPSRMTLTHAPSTTAIVSDIWLEAGQIKDIDAYLQEENTATTGGMIVGNIQDSQQTADGIAYQDWVAPQEIIEMMATLDGFKVAMYEPARDVPASALVVSDGNAGSAGLQTSTSLQTSTMLQTSAGDPGANYWYRQPPELRYEAWADLGEPDYHVRLSRGAVWEPSTEPDDLQEAVYVNYTDRKGRSQSVFVEDATTENRMYEQGRHSAVDWQIDPSVGAQTAQTLAQQFILALRQPALSGTLTIYGDRPGSIELPGGARISKLVRIRPGVVRIIDGKGAKSGRITDMTYTARTGSGPDGAEKLVMTINTPASARLNRNLARLSHRADLRRTR